MEKWMKKSWFFQQELYNKVKDRCWDHLNDDEIIEKIKYSFIICFGSDYMEKLECKEMFNDTIKKVFAHYGCCQKKLLSCTFINSRIDSDDKEYIHCVFWAQINKHGKAVCIDMNGRLYENWADFIDNNKLPKCEIMYPEGGKYVHSGCEINDYVNVICEESSACGLFNVFKTVIEVGASVLSATAIVVLVSNPLSAPIAIGSMAALVTGGAISTTCATGRLLDIHRYEGLDITSGKSLFAIADVVLSSVGMAAGGVMSGCKVLSTGSQLLSKSVAAVRLANLSSLVYKVVSGVSSVYAIINAIYKYTTNTLSAYHLQDLRLMLHFMYNITVSTPVVAKLIAFISSCTSFSAIADNLNAVKNKVFAYSRSVRKFVGDCDLSALLEFLFPVKIVSFVKKMTEIRPLKTAFKALDNIKSEATTDPISLLYNLLKQMPMILKEVDNYLNSSQEQLAKKCDTNVCKRIKQWTSNDGIDISDDTSTFHSKLNLPIDLLNKVCNLLTLLGNENDNVVSRLLQKKHVLVNTILTMIFKHDTKSYTYIVNKGDFYCEKFGSIYRDMTDLLHWHYYRFTVDNGMTKSRDMFFADDLRMKQDVVDHVFKESLVILQNCVNDLHAEYDCVFEKSKISEPKNVGKLIFKWQVPKCTIINEEFFYSTALKHLPDLSTKILKTNTVFEIHQDCLAIITSIKDNFSLYFYFVDDNYNIKGMLIYVEA